MPFLLRSRKEGIPPLRSRTPSKIIGMARETVDATATVLSEITMQLPELE